MHILIYEVSFSSRKDGRDHSSCNNEHSTCTESQQQERNNLKKDLIHTQPGSDTTSRTGNKLPQLSSMISEKHLQIYYIYAFCSEIWREKNPKGIYTARQRFHFRLKRRISSNEGKEMEMEPRLSVVLNIAFCCWKLGILRGEKPRRCGNYATYFLRLVSKLKILIFLNFSSSKSNKTV